MSHIGREIRERLLSLPTGTSPVVAGATGAEIRELESYAKAQLPSVYKEFLSELGRSSGELFRGSDYSIGGRFHLRLREHAEELLRRKSAPFVLPETAFVFLMAQGYQFAFFHLGQGDDPPAYYYLEGDAQPRLLDPTLSGYLRRCIESCEEREKNKGIGSRMD